MRVGRCSTHLVAVESVVPRSHCISCSEKNRVVLKLEGSKAIQGASAPCITPAAVCCRCRCFSTVRCSRTTERASAIPCSKNRRSRGPWRGWCARLPAQRMLDSGKLAIVTSS